MICLKTKNNSLTVCTIFFNLQNHPTFHSEERLVNLVRGRECFVGLSILLVYTVAAHISNIDAELGVLVRSNLGVANVRVYDIFIFLEYTNNVPCEPITSGTKQQFKYRLNLYKK